MGVLPQMRLRIGHNAASLFDETSRNPNVVVLNQEVSQQQWQQIVQYYLGAAPDSLPHQAATTDPIVDPAFFKTVLFNPAVNSSAIITLLKTDTVHRRIFVGEAGTNTLRVLDWNRKVLSTLTLASPPTDLIVEPEHILILESGILDPNDEPKGALVQYDFADRKSLRSPRVLIDSLLRPVFAQEFDFDNDGRLEFLICEYGNNRGRLALYRNQGARYTRDVIDPGPGAIRFEIRDMTRDGAPDIVALFGQGDERIVLFENDGAGKFVKSPRTLTRFPPVYGSMNFSLHDFNGDGNADIVYVNGDNFDFSRVLKPYHGIRILENDGNNNFRERFLYPVYGAARAEVADFDADGDLDILVTSNFADFKRHPERGITFLENTGRYTFKPFAFTIAARNQWNLTAVADLNEDGRPDVIVGAMDLANISRLQHRAGSQAADALLLFENGFQSKQMRR